MEWTLGIVTLTFVLLGITGWRYVRKLAQVQHLTLRRIDIVDDQGKVRVVLAAPLPPPTSFGKIVRRDAPMSGVLLFDATGTERGGYATGEGSDGNALLTLDAQGRQTVLLLAEPDGSTLFRLWDRQSGSVTMGSGDSGPFLNVRRGSSLFLSAPTNNEQSISTKPLFR